MHVLITGDKKNIFFKNGLIRAKNGIENYKDTLNSFK